MAAYSSRADVLRLRLQSLYAALYNLPTSGPAADLAGVMQSMANLQSEIADVEAQLVAEGAAAPPVIAKRERLGLATSNERRIMSDTSSRLRTLAARIRQLPQSVDFESPLIVERIAGEVLLEAIDLGAFSGPEHAGFLNRIHRARLCSEDYPRQVFLEFLGEGFQGDRLQPYSLIADAIEAVAARLEVEENGNTGSEKSPAGRTKHSQTIVFAQGKRFRVALSFPGEHRGFVAEVAEGLVGSLGRHHIFYDRYYEAELARPDLDTYLQRIYHNDSDLIAVFLCSEYERKEWCGLEWRAIRDLIKRRNVADIMPFRFDDTSIPGLFSIDGYVEIGKRSPPEIASLILERLAHNDQQT